MELEQLIKLIKILEMDKTGAASADYSCREIKIDKYQKWLGDK